MVAGALGGFLHALALGLGWIFLFSLTPVVASEWIERLLAMPVSWLG
jgi:hypothetical protein